MHEPRHPGKEKGKKFAERVKKQTAADNKKRGKSKPKQ